MNCGFSNIIRIFNFYYNINPRFTQYNQGILLVLILIMLSEIFEFKEKWIVGFLIYI